MKLALPKDPAKGQSVRITPEKSAVWAGDRYIPSKRGRTVVQTGGYVEEGWVRPADWLTLPAMVDGDERVDALVAIPSSGVTYVTLSFDCPYTVDWGDGVVENFAADVFAEHTYDYATYDVTGETLCTRGYKQAILQAYPTEGNHVTKISFHNSARKTNASQFLDISIGAPGLTTLYFARNGGSTTYVFHYFLEQFSLYQNSISDATDLLSGAVLLRKVANLYVRNVTIAKSMFSTCAELIDLPKQLDFQALSDATSMFSGCSRLREIPVFSTSSLLIASTMFSSCESLVDLPPIDLSAATHIGSIFSGCVRLKSLAPVTWRTDAPYTEILYAFNNLYLLEDIGSFPMWLNCGSGNVNTTAFSFLHSLKELHIETFGEETKNHMLFQGIGGGLRVLTLSDATNYRTYNVSSAPSPIVSNASGLTRVSLPGIHTDFSVYGAALDAAALNTLFEEMATVTSATVNIGLNPGAATCDRSIATSKGWTIVG